MGKFNDRTQRTSAGDVEKKGNCPQWGAIGAGLALCKTTLRSEIQQHPLCALKPFQAMHQV
jgi:hypothetical protein